MFEKIISMFQKPSEDKDNGVVLVHKDYTKDESKLPIHYQPPISRLVLSQQIVNKDDYIKFVNEYKDDKTKIFFNNQRVRTVFNFSLKDTPDYGDSFCDLILDETADYREFKRYLDHDISQKSFIKLLKRLEPYIIAFDGRETSDMDIIEMAENLQGVTKFESIQRNSSSKFSIDATVGAGKSSLTMPKTVTFRFPVFKNEMELETTFEVELFLTAQDGNFTANLVCYNIEQLYDETIRQLTESINDGIDGVKSYQS